MSEESQVLQLLELTKSKWREALTVLNQQIKEAEQGGRMNVSRAKEQQTRLLRKLQQELTGQLFCCVLSLVSSLSFFFLSCFSLLFCIPFMVIVSQKE